MASLTRQGEEAELPRGATGSVQGGRRLQRGHGEGGRQLQNKQHQPHLPLPITLSHESV